jgi:hypothetical protein
MVESKDAHVKKDEIKAASDALTGVERLLDPLHDRQVKDVPKPPRFPMKSSELFIEKGNFSSSNSCLAEGRWVPNFDLIRKHLMIEGLITKECLVRILTEVTAILSKLSLP